MMEENNPHLQFKALMKLISIPLIGLMLCFVFIKTINYVDSIYSAKNDNSNVAVYYVLEPVRFITKDDYGLNRIMSMKLVLRLKSMADYQYVQSNEVDIKATVTEKLKGFSKSDLDNDQGMNQFRHIVYKAIKRKVNSETDKDITIQGLIDE